MSYNVDALQAKECARGESKWLLVNIQSVDSFSSHMLNRDTWKHEVLQSYEYNLNLVCVLFFVALTLLGLMGVVIYGLFVILNVVAMC